MESCVGGCRLIEEVGRGATGAVFKAERNGQIVAVKLLADPWASDPAMAERFLAEGRIMRRLSHPAIVKIFDVGRDLAKFYLVMEFVDGPPFARAIERRAFTQRQTAGILSSVARALQHAHRMGVIHGDVVPSNILLKGDGAPKLTDFGIARLRGRMDGWRAGVTAGTPVYMSPEQAAAMTDVIDVRSDVYSLGAVLYEAVTGRPPFVGRSTAEVLEKVARAAPPAPRMVEPAVDPGLEKIILKAMDKDPARRYATAKEFAVALQAWARTAPDWFSMLPS